jgi:hypothetical protein
MVHESNVAFGVTDCARNGTYSPLLLMVVRVS